MPDRTSRALVLAYLRALSHRDEHGVGAAFAPDVVVRIRGVEYLAAGGSGLWALVRSARALWVGVSALAVVPDLIVSDGSHVAARWTITGTHTGPFLGRAATGRRATFTASGVGVVRDDRLVEWAEIVDLLTVLHQIGALETAAHPPQ